MSQSPLTTPDGNGAAVLNEIAAALQALGSMNSGPAAPTTTYDHEYWADTTSGWMKVRNGANSAWINLFPLDTWGMGHLFHSDYFNDRVVSGLTIPVPSPSSLTASIASGTAYITGARVTLASQNITVNASSDSYVDISNQGAVTLAAVANGAAAPAVTASSIRIAKVVSNATQITAITDLRQLAAQQNVAKQVSLSAGFVGSLLQLLVGGTSMLSVDQAGNLVIGGTASIALGTQPNHAAQVSQIPAGSVRQTVLTGSVDANGMANFLSAGSGLAVNLAATAIPVVVAFAAGFMTSGVQDYVGRINADVAGAWSGLTASATLFLYVDRNPSTGALTYGFSALQPVYATTAPATPAVDQHWFDLTQFQMKRYTGSAWAVVQRVFLGECVTGTASVSSVTTYALQGRYDSGLFSVAASTTYTKNHNLGVQNFDFAVHVADDATGTNERLCVVDAYFNSTYYGYEPRATTRNSVSVVSQANISTGSTGGSQTSGYYRFIARRPF